MSPVGETKLTSRHASGAAAAEQDRRGTPRASSRDCASPVRGEPGRPQDLAGRRDQDLMADLDRKFAWQFRRIVLTNQDQRDQMHWEEFEQTWSKRRRLAREKNEIETPKVQRPVPKVEKPPKPFDWSPGPVPSRLTTEQGLADLSAIDVSRCVLTRANRPRPLASSSSSCHVTRHQQCTEDTRARPHQATDTRQATNTPPRICTSMTTRGGIPTTRPCRCRGSSTDRCSPASRPNRQHRHDQLRRRRHYSPAPRGKRWERKRSRCHGERPCRRRTATSSTPTGTRSNRWAEGWALPARLHWAAT